MMMFVRIVDRSGLFLCLCLCVVVLVFVAVHFALCEGLK